MVVVIILENYFRQLLGLLTLIVQDYPTGYGIQYMLLNITSYKMFDIWFFIESGHTLPLFFVISPFDVTVHEHITYKVNHMAYTSYSSAIDNRGACIAFSQFWQDPQRLAVLDDVIVNLLQRLVLVLEPFPEQLRRRQAHARF
jgi:hypothetical protein